MDISDVKESRTAPEAGEAAGEPSKRRQVLEGARRVFLASGFDGASMGEIARAAGVSKGTLYVYFESKEALFEALTVEEKRAQAESLLQLDPEDPDLHGVLRRLALDVMALMTQPDHVSAVRMVIGAVEKFPQFGRAYYEAGPACGHGRLTAYLSAHIAAGRLRDCDPATAARHYFDLCHAGVIRRLMFGVEGPVDPVQRARIVDDALRVFFAAYGPE